MNDQEIQNRFLEETFTEDEIYIINQMQFGIDRTSLKTIQNTLPYITPQWENDKLFWDNV